MIDELLYFVLRQRALILIFSAAKQTKSDRFLGSLTKTTYIHRSNDERNYCHKARAVTTLLQLIFQAREKVVEQKGRTDGWRHRLHVLLYRLTSRNNMELNGDSDITRDILIPRQITAKESPRRTRCFSKERNC